ncbi:hypothetical protein [Rubellimicrobium arenae]|uniref:hypothetical protein n=1 Tax=Rubellimicrobium arenae TaxID=2817372 RepID=UPI001B3081E7|nr:hypothetical protein [Rubellimicrobium arenae]
MVTYIHIGMQKTGTTFLQKALTGTAQDLKRVGITYPDPNAVVGSRTETAHHFLAHAILGRRKRHTPSADFSLLAPYVDFIKTEISNGGGTGIISSEDLSGLRLQGIERLRELFDPDTKIVVYLRRQDAWIDSLYGQILKVGRETTADQVIADEAWRLDYDQLLEPWAATFGASNIIVRPYEGLQGTALWSDFFTAVGRPDGATVTPEIESANDSLSFELTMVLKALNIYGEQRELRRIFEGMSDHFPNRPGLKYLSHHQAQDLLARYAASNQAVAEKYLTRDALFTDMNPLQQAEHQDLSTTQTIQVFGGLTLHLLRRIRRLEGDKRDLVTKIDALNDRRSEPSK